MSINDIFNAVLTAIIIFLVLSGPVRAFFRRARERRESSENSLKRAELGLEASGGAVQKVTVDRLSTVRGEHIVAVVNVFGPILSDPGATPPFSRTFATFGERVKDILFTLKADERVKAVLVRIQTPGGSPSGAESIREGIDECNKSKPVFVHVNTMSASGGVWAMVGARKIFSEASALLGSIGVIGPTVYHYEDVTSVGQGLLGTSVNGKIDATVFSVGKGKSFGSPFAPRDAEAETHFQSLLEKLYAQFKQVVLTSRPKILEQELDRLGAMVLDAHGALELGLIDAVGSKRDAEQALLAEANLTYEDATFVQIQETPRGRFSTFFAEFLPSFLPNTMHAQKLMVEESLSRELLLTISPLWAHSYFKK